MIVPVNVPTPPLPPFTPTLVARVEVVTLTVTTSGSSTSTSTALPSGGGSSVPIAAIAGGAAGGVTLAVILVLIWKYWGLIIKRDERQRRKEVQDMLTVRENTRRNASSGFKPQSQYRPMLALNPDRRRVKFLTRSPTASSSRKKKQQRAPSPVPVGGGSIQRRGDTEADTQAPPLTPAPMLNEASRQPSLGQPLLPGSPEVTESPPENNNVPRSHTEVHAPTPATVSQPTPTPTHTTTKTPTTVPVAHAPVRRVHIQASSPLSTAQPLMPSGSSSMPWDVHDAPTPGSSKVPPVPTFSPPPVSTTVPPLPAGAAPPIPHGQTPPPPAHSSSSSSWATTSRSPLRNSVLAVSDRPVIMPRPKNPPWAPTPAPGPSSQPAPSLSPAPSLATSASHHSGNSGESMTRRAFLNALRNKPPAQAGPSTNVR